jgi:outer membrane receptor for ferric coprogen and ferric-rhodotorulic acid
LIVCSNRLLAGTACCALLIVSVPALAEEPGEQPSAQYSDDDDAASGRARFAGGDQIVVTALRDNRVSNGATNLPLSIVDTPQSVTVVSRETMDRFAQDDANEVLRYVTGLNVEAVETDRTYYNARGFDIKSMQVDGQGLPFKWNVVGALDTVVYERIEVVRGANGLLTGTGNPSGTINYVRKRPLNGALLAGELTAGTDDLLRGEADFNVPLDGNGNWTARLVGAYQQGDSYLRDYETERAIGQAIIEGQIGPQTVASLGYVQQNAEGSGVLWGALPLLYTDGTQTDYPRTTSTTMDWTTWETRNRTAFAEVVQGLSDDWQARAIVTWNDYNEPSELFYVYGRPDRDTGEGLFGWPGSYLQTSERWMADVSLTGTFGMLGQVHDLVLGANLARSQNDYLTYHAPAGDPAWGPLPSLPNWTGEEVARPAFDRDNPEHSADFRDTMKRLYGAVRLSATDQLKLIAGFNAAEVKTEGFSFGEPMNRSESAIAPYLGFTFAIMPSVNLYASYSDIFEPQAELGEDLTPIGSATGESYEAGVKGEIIPGRLFASLAWFRAEQQNIADYAGFDVGSGQSYYRGINVVSRGIEAEVGGRLAPWFSLQGGFTHMKLDDGDGNKVRTFVPRSTANLGFTVEPTDRVAFGVLGRWQDDIFYDTGTGVIRQDDYAVLNAFARAELTEHLGLGLNVTNLTNTKHLTSLYWEQAFYAAPRGVSLSLRMRY